MTKEEKCSKTQLGRIVIHKENKEKRVYPNELQVYIDDGWIKGASDSHKRNNKGNPNAKNSVRYTDGVKECFIKQGEQPPPGWRKGCSVEHSKKNGDAHRGKSHFISEETKRKISEAQKGCVGHRLGQKNTKEHNRKISEAQKGKPRPKLTEEQLRIKLSKEYITRKKNHTFNSSSVETQFYNQLLEENKTKTIYRHYKDNERYPFYCDFYIVEDDLFIELNAHWTHGGKPYNKDDKECEEQLLIWQEKAKTSKFYQNAIETWTVRDVKKQRVAKENNLNYKVIY